MCSLALKTREGLFGVESQRSPQYDGEFQLEERSFFLNVTP
jgi:hypothetical protein